MKKLHYLGLRPKIGLITLPYLAAGLVLYGVTAKSLLYG